MVSPLVALCVGMLIGVLIGLRGYVANRFLKGEDEYPRGYKDGLKRGTEMFK